MTTQSETLALVEAHRARDDGRFNAVVRRLAEDAERKAGRRTSYVTRLRNALWESGEEMLRLPDQAKGLVDLSMPFEDAHRLVLDTDTERDIDHVCRQWSKRDSLLAHDLRPTNRILLSGPPGTGKTTLARQIALRLDLPLLSLRLDRLLSSRLGGSLRNAGSLFESLQAQPCVLFIDEADALFADRSRDGHDVDEMRRLTNLLLQKVDGWSSEGMLVAATNLATLIDAAAFRRFDIHIRTTTADRERATRIITSRFEEMDLRIDGVEKIAEHAIGLPPALIVRACENEARNSIIEDRPVDGDALSLELGRDAKEASH